MIWSEFFELIKKVLPQIENDKVRIYDENTGDFIDADVITFDDDDVIDKQNLFIWKKEET